MDQNNRRLSRREFLRRFFDAGLAAGVTMGVGKYFSNRNPVPPKNDLFNVRKFNVENTRGLFAVAKGENPSAITIAAMNAAGGISRFIRKGDDVLIKVNCAFARPAWAGATTSPEVTAEVVKLCYQAGASRVRVTDNPISDPKSCFLKSGIEQAVRDAGGEIVLPSPADFRVVQVSRGVIGQWEVFYSPLAACDKLIGIPTLKTHNLCGASLCMKNWYGLIGGSRSRFHQDIHHVVAELGQFITPTFVVLDATRMLMRNGPTGGSAQDVAPGNTVVVSTDQVAVDAYGAQMLSLTPDVVKYIQIAEQMNLGQSNYSKLPGFKEVSV